MADVLAEIVAHKRQEVAARLRGFDASGIAPTTRSLRAALARPGARFIMEVKRASPSGHRSVHSIETAIRAYAGVADGVSVLTDERFFAGSFAALETVRARFDGPILAKDFVVVPAQVAEARRHGADAVLCMLSVLGDEEAQGVMAEAARLGMDVLVEVHDEAELDRALALGATLVGINNRDLKTLKTDLAVTERMAAKVPDSVTLVSESGIAARGDVERLSRHADAFLVGSSLMAADDPFEAARALVFGRVKVCGLTRVEDVEAAAASGATHAGIILVRGTPRAVDRETALALAATARDAGLKPVGVFRDDEPRDVARAAATAGLFAVQLHGHEDAAHVAMLRNGFSGEIWTVGFEDRGGDRLVFDSPGGGTGRPCDWGAVAKHPAKTRAFLAGGIGPDNARAAQDTGVYGLDASSRLEAAPGIKDHAQIAALFDALRLPDRRQNDEA
ncbi:bifunctional indole-3-glycerol-phosphate synthase TrpC/phosphoribosylanthranilate isomerase TrpF [Sphingomonas astaxanthinifaciens]|uniref:N-(5'-phosphoribosyl)anthranilate isomerase n=1 Tax=Sphingomonas astaxanthinifaciens DSM 22298 TaxID=1123267 RepID=A0ABQ5Z7J4_9SPHN|nr:bifunctional indole-3-glycerol-phosphate synthase TrpC/phosphoribosylanthranilate isomerase TrpF [Sphingomonas astaxanthinifaciens]GLR47914.1 bifunctional indole-3-glycerol phosphate synthase/phosphoribosylanthranilate isomerase [Sphingomonas astaxanthinifaciens DSM 22298]